MPMTDTAVLALVLILVGVFGLLIGSFLNVVIARVPQGLSIIRPGSACPKCEEPIAWFDNIPVISWVFLRGKCRHCHQGISARYPFVELVNAAAWVVLSWWCLRTSDEVVQGLLPLLLAISSFSIVLTLIDIDHHRLPDAVVFWMYPAAVAGLAYAGVVTGQWPLSQSLLMALVWLVVIGGVWLVTAGRGMGFGDVKLAPILGLILGWVGWGQGFVGLFSAWLLGGLVGLTLILMRKAQRGTALAFGPFLIIGFWVGLCVGGPVAQWYLGGTGLI
jgi:leader peptidase (prepilin peptidase)/N-methyltransferase